MQHAIEILSLSPLPATSLVWQARRDAFVLTVVVKATYVLAPGTAELASEQEHPNEEDNHWNDDVARSVYSPSDLAPRKPRAEVLLVGHAFAPRGERARSVVARLLVGEVDKAVEVFADRSFMPDGSLRDGTPFTRVPLRYERAAGGLETANPVGVRNDARDPFGALALPSLQPPGLTVSSATDVIPPIGFGPLAPTWPTRREKLGPYAGRWSERLLAVEPLPDRIDPHYFMAAPPDQQLGQLRADERIVLEHLHADHPRLVTNLPGVEPRAFAQIGKGPPQELALIADTLWIDTDRSVATLTWRAQLQLEHAQVKGRVLVGMARRGWPLTWAELEAEARRRRGAPRTASLTASLTASMRADELLSDDERATPPPAPLEREESTKIGMPRSRTLVFGQALSEPTDPGTVVGDASPAWLRARAALDGATPVPASPPRPIAPATAPPPPAAAPQPVRFGPPPGSPSPLEPPARAWQPVGEAKPLVPSLSSPIASPSPLATMPPATVGQQVAARGSADVAKQGVAAVSNAAAGGEFRVPSQVDFTPAPAGVARSNGEGMADRRVSFRPREVVELLWFDPALAPRLRSAPAFSEVVAAGAPNDAWITSEQPVRDPQTERAERDRRDVLRALGRADPVDLTRLDKAVDEAFDEDGAFSPPLALTSGELTFRFDEREALRATVTTVTPILGADKRLRDTVTEAADALKGDWPLPDDVAEGFTRRIEAAFNQAPRVTAPGYLQGSVDKLLLEGRHYRTKSVFSESRIRAELAVPGSDPIPVYLPVALAMRLPLFSRFRAVMIVELRTQEDQHETHPHALLAFAIARVLERRRG